MSDYTIPAEWAPEIHRATYGMDPGPECRCLYCEKGHGTVCVHDWRVDPRVYVWPPSQRLVCAKCSAESSRMLPSAPGYSIDPNDWPKA